MQAAQDDAQCTSRRTAAMTAATTEVESLGFRVLRRLHIGFSAVDLTNRHICRVGTVTFDPDTKALQISTCYGKEV